MNNWRELLNEEETFTFKRARSENYQQQQQIVVINEPKPLKFFDEDEDDESAEDECFGCEILAEKNYVAMKNEDLIALIEYMRKTIGKVNPKYLAGRIAKKYKKIQQQVNKNVPEGFHPLPDWTKERIMKHWLLECLDPELQGWLRMWEMAEVAQIALKASKKCDDEGNQYIDIYQDRIYNQKVEKMEALYKSDVSKKMYYSGGAVLNSKTINEGPICYSGKNIKDHFRLMRHNKTGATK